MRKITVIIALFLAAIQIVSAQKVGLVLSGGGAKGAAHIGVIKALEENNIPIDSATPPATAWAIWTASTPTTWSPPRRCWS